MSQPSDEPETENVRVAVRIRPLNSAELENQARTVAHKTANEPHITLGERHQFTFDDVFPVTADQQCVFHSCVRDLVDKTIQGRNATVLAYGQTGSGKTYTMGTGCEIGLSEEQVGILPRVATYLFEKIDELTQHANDAGVMEPEFKVTVSFLELYQGKFYDLFDSTPGLRQEAPVRIRDERGDDGTVTIHMSGVSHCDVTRREDVMDLLRRGSLDRVTASTDMNERSSRSHAIFTVWITHRRHISQAMRERGTDSAAGGAADLTGPSATEDGSGASDVPGATETVTTTSKFNFVDLAGSERLKRTHATGERAKEGIDINSGLLALGNVISALGDPARRGAHVPYRSNKLTRILQDSLGGNSKTLMIACISPADKDLMETLNTLKYANRARNIQNKVVINQDSASREIQFLREQIHKMNLELMEYRQGRRPVNPDSEEAEDMFKELYDLREKNKALTGQVKELRTQLTHMKRETIINQVASIQGADGDAKKTIEVLLSENLELRSKLDAVRAGGSAVNGAAGSGSGGALVADAQHGRPGTAGIIRPWTATSTFDGTGLSVSRPLTAENSDVVSQSLQVMKELEETYGLSFPDADDGDMSAGGTGKRKGRKSRRTKKGQSETHDRDGVVEGAGAEEEKADGRGDAGIGDEEKKKEKEQGMVQSEAELKPSKHRATADLAEEEAEDEGEDDEEDEEEGEDQEEEDDDDDDSVYDDSSTMYGCFDDEDEDGDDEDEDEDEDGEDEAGLEEEEEEEEDDDDEDIPGPKSAWGEQVEGEEEGEEEDDDDENNEEAPGEEGAAGADGKRGGSNKAKKRAEEKKKRAELMTKYREMMQELGTRIVLHENLLKHLEAAQNEIQKQKQLYERRLLQEKQERDKVLAEREELRRRLKDMEGHASEESAAERTKHHRRLQELQQKLSAMERERSRQQRVEQDRQRAMAQIDALRRSIRDAKAERKRLMEQAQAEMKKSRVRQARHNREMTQLRRDLDKERTDASRWERQLRNKETRMTRVKEENQKLKQSMKERQLEIQDLRRQLMQARMPGKTAGGTRTGGSGSTAFSRTGTTGSVDGGVRTRGASSSPSRRSQLGRMARSVLRRRSSVGRVARVEAERKRAKLEQEITSAVLYQTVKARIEALVQRRDGVLAQEKNSLVQERAGLVTKKEAEHTQAEGDKAEDRQQQQQSQQQQDENADAQGEQAGQGESNSTGDDEEEAETPSNRLETLDAEIERIETEMNLVTEEIQENERSLLSMEYQGIRACLTMDDISEEGDNLIRSASQKEAHLLLRSLFSALVRKELASERTRVRVRQLELEAEAKNSILHSLAAASLSPKPATSRNQDEQQQQQRRRRQEYLQRYRQRSRHRQQQHGLASSLPSSPSKAPAPRNSSNTMTSAAVTSTGGDVGGGVGSRTRTLPSGLDGGAAAAGGELRKRSSLVTAAAPATAAATSSNGGTTAAEQRASAPPGMRARSRTFTCESSMPKGSAVVVPPPSSVTDATGGTAGAGAVGGAGDDQAERPRASSSSSSSSRLRSVRRRIVSAFEKTPHYSRSTEAAENKRRGEREQTSLPMTLRMSRRPKRAKAPAVPSEIVEERLSAGLRPAVLRPTHTVRGHDDHVLCLAACGEKLITGSKDKTARVWDLQAGQLQQTLAGHEAPVKALACLDTHFLTVCRNVVRVWDIRTCEDMDRFTVKKDTIQDIQVSPDGTYLFAASSRSLRIWDLRMKREVKNFAHRGKIETLRLNAAGDKLALATIDHKVRIFDVPNLPGGALTYQTLEPPHYDRVHALTFAGDHVFSGSDDCSVKKWSNGDMGWYNRQTTTGAHAGVAVSALCSLPGNGFLVSGSAKGGMKVWRGDRLSAVEEHMRHTDAITALTCHKSRLFSASADRTVKIWDVNIPSITDTALGDSGSSKSSSRRGRHRREGHGGGDDNDDGDGGAVTPLNETRPVTPTMEDAPSIDSSRTSGHEPQLSGPLVQTLSGSPPPHGSAVHDALMPMRAKQQQQQQQQDKGSTAASKHLLRQSRYHVDL